MAKRRNDIDLFNTPVLIARQLGMEQVQAFLRQMPNPAGQMDADQVPTGPSMSELKRIFGRQ
jgi:hypothetical protein